MRNAVMIGIPLYRNIAITQINQAKVAAINSVPEGPERDLYNAYLAGGQAAMGAFVQSQQQAEKSSLEKAGDKVSDLSNNPIVQGVAVGAAVLASGGLAAALLAPGSTGAAAVQGNLGQIGTNLTGGLGDGMIGQIAENTVAPALDVAGSVADVALIPAKAIGTGAIFGGEAVAGLIPGAASAVTGGVGAATAGIETVVGGVASVGGTIAGAETVLNDIVGQGQNLADVATNAESILADATGALLPEELTGTTPHVALPPIVGLPNIPAAGETKPAASAAPVDFDLNKYMPIILLAGGGLVAIIVAGLAFRK